MECFKEWVTESDSLGSRHGCPAMGPRQAYPLPKVLHVRLNKLNVKPIRQCLLLTTNTINYLGGEPFG